MVDSILEFVRKHDDSIDIYFASIPKRFDADSLTSLLGKTNGEKVGRFEIGTLKLESVVCAEEKEGEEPQREIVGVEFWHSTKSEWLESVEDTTHTSFMGMPVYRWVPLARDQEVGKVIFGGYWVRGFDLLFIEGPYG